MKITRKEISYEELHKLFYYKDGNLYNKTQRTNRVKIDSIVGYKDSANYLITRINNKVYKIHRLIYKMFNKYWDMNTSLVIDHKDTNKQNNCIDNLRLITQKQNSTNINARGYIYEKETNKYKAYIGVDGKLLNLGRFNTEEEAKDTYLKAKEKYHKIDN